MLNGRSSGFAGQRFMKLTYDIENVVTPVPKGDERKD